MDYWCGTFVFCMIRQDQRISMMERKQILRYWDQVDRVVAKRRSKRCGSQSHKRRLDDCLKKILILLA